MIRRRDLGAVVFLLWPWMAQSTVFSGEVQVTGTQEIFTPPSMSSPVVLRYYIDDGVQVQKGDDILRIDAGQAESQLRTLQARLTQMVATHAKEIADLQLKQADAELALADAQAERDTAAIDAVIPKALISGLDYDRYQGEMRRSERALALKKQQVEQAIEMVARRRKDSELELTKQRLSIDFYQGQVDSAVVRAERDGFVVHGFDSLFGAGGRYEEGSTSYPGTKVGDVVGKADAFQVRAWVLDPDRSGLRVAQPVWLYFDALPCMSTRATIQAIGGAAISKVEWGDGRYYALDIALPDDIALPLRQGMSVRVDTALDEADTSQPCLTTPASEPLQIDGEIYPQRSVAISPPAIDGLWQMTVTQMAKDGEAIKQGEMLVAFESAEVLKNLTTQQGQLDEKLRKQEQLRLDLADRAQEAELATAKARAEMEKAQRKANQPKDYIARVDYQKLVVARTKAEQRLKLSERREAFAAEARMAEQRMADAEVDQLSGEVAKWKASLAALTIGAPRDGIVLHQNDWRGGKVDVGSQIWRGQSVAQMPDLSSLAVRASLPERDLGRVQLGQQVDVVLGGAGDRRMVGSIVEIGGTVHSKSRVETVPVLELIVKLEPRQLNLKPGQSVQVRIPPVSGAAR